MAGHKNFNILRSKMSPGRRARDERDVQLDLHAMLISEFQKAAAFHPTSSQLENQSDMQISTLQRLVNSLGGTLEIIATLPGKRISLSQFVADADAD